jgi:hypothetical protein
MLTQFVLFMLLGAPSGGPGHPWALPDPNVDETVPRVFTPSQQQHRECPETGHACFSPGGSATSEGIELRAGAPPITVLARGAQLAAVGALHAPAADQPWQVEMVANFARRSTSDPLIVAIMDAEDHEAVAQHLAVTVLDVSMPPGKRLGLRFLLSPEQGFQPSHSYLVRVVQPQGKEQKILAEGEFHLE